MVTRFSMPRFRAALLLSGAACLAATKLAHAQAAPVAASPTAPPESRQIEEVVVTARKRPERLQNLAATASVVSAVTLTQQNVTDIAQLNNILPAVNINGSFNGRVPLGIRGISSDSNESAIGISSGVGIEIDGIPVPSDSFYGNNIEDITNVELLEGPQATLGGRTATSGIINYITHQPSKVLTGGFSATVTGDGEQHLIGNVAGPLTDGIDFSVTGWGHHTTFPVVNLDGGNHSSQSDQGFRAKLHAELAPGLEATLYGSLGVTRNSGGNFAYTYVYPGAYLLAGVGGGPPFWSQQALFPPNVKIGPNNTDYASPVTDAHENRTDGQIGLNLNYQLGDGYVLSSSSDYQHENRQDVQDLFAVNDYFGTIAQEVLGIPFAFSNSQKVDINAGQVTEEVRLASPAAAPLNYVAGIFYSDSTVQQNQYRLFTPAYDNSFRSADTETADAYVHANWRILPDTTVTGGARFNYDVLSYDIFQLANPYAPHFTPVATFSSAGSHTSSALVGDIGVKQQLAPTVQVYATYTRGYGPEAYNTALQLTNNTPLSPVAQEKINSFEIGTKGRYFGGTLQINASVFYTLYDNYQVQTFVSVPGQTIGELDLQSAGKAVTRGAEADATWRPLDNTLVSLNAALIDAEYLSYKGGPCWWSGPVTLLPSSCYVAPGGGFKADLSHRAAANAPKLKFDIGLDQTVPLTPRLDLLLGGLVSYRSRAQMLPDQNPYGFQAAYTILNLHATVQVDRGRYALTAFVNNVANQHYDADIEDFWNSPWGSNAIVAQPARDTNRYFGFRLDGRF